MYVCILYTSRILGWFPSGFFKNYEMILGYFLIWYFDCNGLNWGYRGKIRIFNCFLIVFKCYVFYILLETLIIVIVICLAVVLVLGLVTGLLQCFSFYIILETIILTVADVAVVLEFALTRILYVFGRYLCNVNVI